MTDEAVPLMVGTSEYYLRFGQDELIAAEDDLKIGYIFFLDTKYASLRLFRTLIHRGLKVKNRKTGELEQAYEPTLEGQHNAGEWIHLYLKHGGTLPDLRVSIGKALDAWPWYKKEETEDEDSEKNSPVDGS
jgi:hypothetical protein